MKFITFEGGEGSGKTTQAKLLNKAFSEAGVKSLLTREPGGTEGAEKIRNLFLGKDSYNFQPTTDLLLINAARYEHATGVILPAIKRGEIVVCDRFVDSTMAYQGFGHKLGKKLPAILHNFMMPNVSPDLTFILDIEPSEGLNRSKKANNVNRYENFSIEFYQRVRRGFHEIADKANERCVLIDATQSIYDIHKQVVNNINQHPDINIQEYQFEIV